jgi:hypothetical protein
MATVSTATPSAPKEHDWTKPEAMAIPKQGYFKLQNGRYGPVYPRTPACYGLTLIAKIKPGREEAIRAYGKTIEKAIADLPDALATLKLHSQVKQTKDDLENAMDDLNRTTNRLRRKFDPTSNYLETKAQMQQVMDSARRVNQLVTKGNYGVQTENTGLRCARISMTLRDATT